MCVEVGVSSLYADKNPLYGIGKGLTMYRHVSEQYSAFNINVNRVKALCRVLLYFCAPSMANLVGKGPICRLIALSSSL